MKKELHLQTAEMVVATLSAQSVQSIDCLSQLTHYAEGTIRQYEFLVSQLNDLLKAPLQDCYETAGKLCEASQALEAVFKRIDALEIVLDNVNEKILVLHAAVRDIESPPNIKDKALSLFRRFGMSSDSGGRTNDSVSGAWGRIPPRLALDGSTPSEFSQRLRGVLSDLDVRGA